MKHPKDIGDKSTIAIVLALGELKYGVFVPLGENSRSDLVIDDGSHISRVQCKTGRLINGAIRFSTASTYAHHPNPKLRRRTYQGEIDLFAVYCPETGGIYLIPIEDAGTGCAASLRVDAPRNGQRIGIRPAANYEIGRVEVSGKPERSTSRSETRSW